VTHPSLKRIQPASPKTPSRRRRRMMTLVTLTMTVVLAGAALGGTAIGEGTSAPRSQSPMEPRDHAISDPRSDLASVMRQMLGTEPSAPVPDAPPSNDAESSEVETGAPPAAPPEPHQSEEAPADEASEPSAAPVGSSQSEDEPAADDAPGDSAEPGVTFNIAPKYRHATQNDGAGD
jgi:hypothetical protein